MGFLSDFFSNPIQTTWDTLSSIPGSPEAIGTGLYQGFNGDISWNPYDPNGASVWDVGAGGTELSKDAKNRAIGRTIGTAIGNYFTAGGLSSLTGSTAAGAAGAGALWGGAQSAGSGGSFTDGAIKGGVSQGLGSFTPDVSGYMGISDPNLGGAINGGVKGGVTAGLSGGNIGQGVVQGAAPGLAQYGYSQYQGTPSGTTPNFTPVTQQEAATNQYSPAPWKTESYSPTLNDMVGGTAQYKSASSAAPNAYEPAQTSQGLSDQVLNAIGLGPSGFNGQRFGDVAQGLASLYLGNKQRRMARDFRNQIAGNRGAYEAQLRRELQRRDAASGRRSNYDGRAVELQSNLARLDSANMPAMAQLSGMETGGLMNMLNAGLVTGNRMGLFGQQPQMQMPSYSSQLPSLNSLGSQSPSYSIFDDQNKNKFKLGGM